MLSSRLGPPQGSYKYEPTIDSGFRSLTLKPKVPVCPQSQQLTHLSEVGQVGTEVAWSHMLPLKGHPLPSPSWCCPCQMGNPSLWELHCQESWRLYMKFPSLIHPPLFFFLMLWRSVGPFSHSYHLKFHLETDLFKLSGRSRNHSQVKNGHLKWGSQLEGLGPSPQPQLAKAPPPILYALIQPVPTVPEDGNRVVNNKDKFLALTESIF